MMRRRVHPRDPRGGFLRLLALGVLAVGVLAVGVTVMPSRALQANGVPQLVKLTYLEGISTWGPTSAEGVLEFSFAEGFLHLDAEGLPRLVGQAYEGWLVRSSSNEAISVGQFNAASDETVVYEAQLPPITDYSLDFFVLTVESLTNTNADPSVDRSIAGFFNVLAPQEPATTGSEIVPGAPVDLGNGAAEGGAGASDGGASASTPATSGTAPESVASTGQAPQSAGAPDRLPETGDPEGFVSSVRGVALILAGGAMLLFAGARTRRRMFRQQRASERRGGTA